MKNKLILLPLFLLLLAGCGPKDDSSSVGTSLEDSSVSIESESIEVPSESSEAPTTMTIAQARAAKDDDLIQTAGVVTARYRDNDPAGATTYSIAIQDGEAAILLYNVSEAVAGATKVGDNIKATGKFVNYYGNMELVEVSEIVPSEATFTVTPVYVDNWKTLPSWKDMDSRLITVKGLSSPYNEMLDPTKSTYYWLWQDQGLEEFLVYINARLGEEAITAMKDVLDASAYFSKSIELTGIVSFYKNVPQLLFYDAALARTIDHPDVDPTAVELKLVGTDVAEVKQNLKLRIASVFTPAEVKSREIRWSSSDHTIAHVDDNGTVTGITPGNATITGTVEDFPEIVDTIDIEVLVMDPINIADALALEAGQIVAVKGTVTSTPSSGNFTLQTDDAAIYLYNVPNDLKASFTVGHDVDVIGTTDEYNGLKQLKSLQSVTDHGETLNPIVPAVVTDFATLTVGWASRLVKVNRLVYVSGSVSTANNTASMIKATLGDRAVDLVVNKYLAKADKEALKAFFDGLTAGDFFDFTGTVGWNSGARLNLDSGDNVALSPYEPGPVTAVTIDSVLGYAVKEGDNLPLTATCTTEGQTKHEVTWSTDNEAVAIVDENGVVTGVSIGKANITATSTVTPEVSDTKEVSVVDPATLTQVLAYETGFEDAEGFVADTNYQNDPKVVGNAPNQWTTYFGTPTTTDAITDGQCIQMRWYKTKVDNLGYAEMNFGIDNLTKVSFNYKSTNGLKMEVLMSTDGGTNWTSLETLPAVDGPTLATIAVSEIGEFSDVRIRFQLVLPDPIPTGTSRLTIDDFKAYHLA